METESIWKVAQKAVAIARSNAPYGGYTMDKVVEIAREFDSPSNHSCDRLWEITLRVYGAIAAAQAGDRSGRRRSGVYFDKHISNVNVQTAFVQNAEQDVAAYTAKAEEIKETHNAVVSKTAIDGQLCMDTKNPENPNNYLEEISLDRLIDLIIAAEQEG